MIYTWSRDTSVTKLSGPARDGSSTRVFAPLTYQIDKGHASQRRTENGSQNLAHVRESSSLFHEVWRRQLFLSQADVGQNWEWKWSSRDLSGPRHITYKWVYLHTLPIWCSSSHSVLSSSLHSHPFLLLAQTEAFLVPPTPPVSLWLPGTLVLVFPRIWSIAVSHTVKYGIGSTYPR